MNTLEQVPDFGMEFDTDFDINAAFQEATHGVISDPELAVEEKIKRMEIIVSEGSSEVYRDFVDFRSMAAQIEMMCSHDHAFNQSMQSSETLNGFMDGFKTEDRHNHPHDKRNHKDDDEIDPKTGKKKKKRSWFDVLSR